MIKDLLPYLPAFAAIARAGSFSRAAAELALSQAAVSYQIKQLEGRLGFALFMRKQGSKIALTEKGSLLLGEYQRLARELDGLLTTLMPSQSRTIIKLTAPVDLGRTRLTPVLRGLDAQGLIFDVQLADRQIDRGNSPFDLAIRRDCQEAQLVYLPLRTRSRSWQELLSRVGLNLSDLSDIRVLGNSFALLEAALAGWGIALLPDYLVQEPMTQGRLLSLTLDEGEPIATPFYLAFYPSVANRLWAEQIQKAMHQPPPAH